MKKSEYFKKLKDPRWQKKRLEVFERDEWACQICFDNEATLNVHHKYYIWKADPWDYPNDALITLCEECHLNETEHLPIEEKRLNKSIRKLFLSSEIRGLSEIFENIKLYHADEVFISVLKHHLLNEERQRKMIDEFFESLGNKNANKK